MIAHFQTVALAGCEYVLDLAAGHVRRLVLSDSVRILAPPHVAPDNPAIANDPSLRANLRHLADDYFCAANEAPIPAVTDKGGSFPVRFQVGTERAVPFGSDFLAGA